MPTYEFRCPDGTIIERSFKISEVPEQIPAPDGSGMAVRQISGGAALLFKGSGFYITDYGKDGKKDQRTAGGSEKKSPDAASGGESAKAGETATQSGDATAKSSDVAPKPAQSAKAESKPASPAPAPKSNGGSTGASGASGAA